MERCIKWKGDEGKRKSTEEELELQERLYQKVERLTALRQQLGEQLKHKDHEISNLKEQKQCIEQELASCQDRNKILEDRTHNQQEDCQAKDEVIKCLNEKNNQLEGHVQRSLKVMARLRQDNQIFSKELEESKILWKKIFQAVDEIRLKVKKCKSMTNQTEAKNNELKKHMKELQIERQKDKETFEKLHECLQQCQKENETISEENKKLKTNLEALDARYTDSRKCLNDLKVRINSEPPVVPTPEDLDSVEKRLLKKYQQPIPLSPPTKLKPETNRMTEQNMKSKKSSSVPAPHRRKLSILNTGTEVRVRRVEDTSKSHLDMNPRTFNSIKSKNFDFKPKVLCMKPNYNTYQSTPFKYFSPKETNRSRSRYTTSFMTYT